MKNEFWDFTTETDSKNLLRFTRKMTETFPFLTVSTIGKSILGTELPVFIFGRGKRHLLYVGTHHGMEWITANLLFRFCLELCEGYRASRTFYRTSLPLLWDQYSLHIVPMLNPDGVDYVLHGVDPENPLSGRVIGMNGGSSDFSHWQANARGVDLNHNYDAGFAEYKQLEATQKIGCGAPTRYSGSAPESEPEVKALCNYIRFHSPWSVVLTLHTQGEEIYWNGRGANLPGAEEPARKFAKLCGYRLAEAQGLSSYGGLSDWCMESLKIRALTVECGKGENPLPISQFPAIYARIRESLFTAPRLYG